MPNANVNPDTLERIAEVLKKRFPNLTVGETIRLSTELARAAHEVEHG